MEQCDTCQAIAQPANVILETSRWIVSLDQSDQHYLGRSFVTTKRHVENLSELSEAEWIELHCVVKKVEEALKKGLGATMLNWSCLMNNAFQAQPFRPHVHWHVRPRYESPVTLNDETFEDVEFGHHYARQTNRSVSNETAQKIVERIKQALH